MPADLTIIHAHPRYVVVDKPSGLLSVPGKGEANRDCVAVRVCARFPNATGPLTVHRLDMETSGLIVLGLDPDAQRDLSMQFERRAVEKRYIALLAGTVAGDSGEIRLPLRLDIDHRPRQMVDFTDGRDAVTRWRILARERNRTRIEFEPVTGRSHQLRLHAATPPASIAAPDGSPTGGPPTGGLGCPILGDTLYGDATSARRLMLHAAFLAFAEPGGERVEFHSPAPF